MKPASSTRRMSIADIQAELARLAWEFAEDEARLRKLYRALPAPRNESMLEGREPYDLKTELKAGLGELLENLRQIIAQARAQSEATEESAGLPWWKRKKRTRQTRATKAKRVRQAHG